MRRVALWMFIGGLIAWGCTRIPVDVTPGLVLYAQSVPATVTTSWNPNAATENVIQYNVILDGVAQTPVLAGVCGGTPVKCTLQVQVQNFGHHTVTVAGVNLNISGDPAAVTGSPQVGGTSSVAFDLNQAPSNPTGLSAK